MSFLSAFNTQLENFAKELNNLYPDDKDIAFAADAIFLLKKTNPRKLYNLIYPQLVEYRKQVFDKDENFFLKRELPVDKNYFDTMIQLQSYWKEMSQKTKDNIWLYLQVLYKLSDKIENK